MKTISALFLFFCICPSVSFASGINFNDTTSQPAQLSGPHFTGNVGIDSTAPGQALDVQGVTRSTNLTVASIASGTQCLQADSSGVVSGTGSACSPASNYWTVTGGTGNVGISTVYSVGIGTTLGFGAGLVVMGGNVGIGTWSSADKFQVGNYVSSVSGFEVDANGNVGIGTTITSASALSIMNGNVGIGSAAPTAALSIVPSDGINYLGAKGTGQTWNITDNGSGYLVFDMLTGFSYALTSSEANPSEINCSVNSCYVEIYTSTGSLADYLGVKGSTDGDGNFFLYNSSGGNGSVDIGIPTGGFQKLQLGSAVIGAGYATDQDTPPANGLLVQGDVGIGTYNIKTTLDIVGNVGIGTGINTPYVTTIPPTGGMIVQGDVGIGTFVPGGGLVVIGNVGIGSVAPSATMVVGTASAHSGTGTCWGTSGCIGYCSAAGGGYPDCTCTCL